MAAVAIGPRECATSDPELLELEAWYWAWRTHTEAAQTDEEGDWSIDATLSVVRNMTVQPARSAAGIAAKLRVFQDLMETVTHIKRPEMDVEANLLDAVVSDTNRLADINS